MTVYIKAFTCYERGAAEESAHIFVSSTVEHNTYLVGFQNTSVFLVFDVEVFRRSPAAKGQHGCVQIGQEPGEVSGHWGGKCVVNIVTLHKQTY